MTTYSDERLKTIISNVSSVCKLVDPRYSINQFDNIGQNYFGLLIPIILSGNLNGKAVDLHLVMKLAPTDERYRVSGALTLFFRKEIFIYSILLPAYKQLEHSYLSQLPFVSPRCYYTCRDYCKELLVIEDMRVKGYKLQTEKFLDFNHVVMSLVSLAKLHALSFILKIKERTLFQEVASVCLPLNEGTNQRFMLILEDRLDKALQHFADTKYMPLLQHIRHNYVKYIDAIVTSVAGTAVCHGDIWKENILFKYENEKPISACIIDYQTARISSPAFDTLFLIITSTGSQLRKVHYHELIKAYYSTFEKVILEAKLNVNDVYSEHQFYSDLKICAPAAFIVANTAMWLASGMQQEGHVRSKIECRSEDDKIKATTFYKDIVSLILYDFCTYEYLNLCVD